MTLNQGGHDPPQVTQYLQEEEDFQVFAQGHLILKVPKLGGNFAMPWLGISVLARPGSLVIWQSLDNNGNLDLR